MWTEIYMVRQKFIGMGGRNGASTGFGVRNRVRVNARVTVSVRVRVKWKSR